MRKDAVSASINAVRESAKRLNAATDRAVETVRAVEEFLESECSVGLTASVQVTSVCVEDEKTGQSWGGSIDLRYCRIGGRFRIAVSEYIEYMEEEELKPWSDCPRELKMQSIEKIPELLKKIADTTNENAAAAEEVVEGVRDVLAALRK